MSALIRRLLPLKLGTIVEPPTLAAKRRRSWRAAAGLRRQHHRRRKYHPDKNPEEKKEAASKKFSEACLAPFSSPPRVCDRSSYSLLFPVFFWVLSLLVCYELPLFLESTDRTPRMACRSALHMTSCQTRRRSAYTMRYALPE